MIKINPYYTLFKTDMTTISHLFNKAVIDPITVISLCFYLSLFLVTLYNQQAFAQSNTSHRFDQISLEEGLSQVSAISIVQDKQGFIWVATQDGLNRYDGYQFKVYKHDKEDPTSISANHLLHLYKDSKDNLWISTKDTGLSRFDSITEQFTHFRHDENNSNSLSNNRVKVIYEDHAGFLWFGTSKGLNLSLIHI